MFNCKRFIYSEIAFLLGTLNGDRPKVIYRVKNCLPDGIDFHYWLFVRSRLELESERYF